MRTCTCIAPMRAHTFRNFAVFVIFVIVRRQFLVMFDGSSKKLLDHQSLPMEDHRKSKMSVFMNAVCLLSAAPPVPIISHNSIV